MLKKRNVSRSKRIRILDNPRLEATYLLVKKKHSDQVKMEFRIGGGKYYKKWSTNILGISGQF